MSWKLNRNKWKKPANKRPKFPSPILYLEQLEKRWLMSVDLQLFNMAQATEFSPISGRLLGQLTGTTNVAANYLVTLTWGDGGSSVASLVALGDPKNTIQILGSHEYDNVGAYTVTLDATGPSSFHATKQTGILVIDAPLTATYQQPAGVTVTEGYAFENREVATFTDPDPQFIGTPSKYSATIDWGNNSQTLATSIIYDYINDDFVVMGGELYEQRGTYGVTVTIRSPEGSVAKTSGSIAVVAWPLEVIGSSVILDQIPEQVDSDSHPYPARFIFDPYDPGPFKASIDWGDGTTTEDALVYTYTMVYTTPAGFPPGKYGLGYVVASHTFGASSVGYYVVTIHDLHTGDEDSASSYLTYYQGEMPDNPPWPAASIAPDTVHLTGTPIYATEGQEFAGTIATFTAPTPTDPYYANIYWGDGGADDFVPVTSSGAGYAVTGTHTYDAPGDYHITILIQQLKLVDTVIGGGGTFELDDNSTWRTGTSALVADGALTATPANFTTAAGVDTSSELLATFTDATGLDFPPPYEAFIDWGDGSPITVADSSYMGVLGSTVYVYGPDHTYANPGVYQTSVLIRESNADDFWWQERFEEDSATIVTDSCALVNGRATVNPIPASSGALSGQANQIAGTEGSAVSFSGSFDDSSMSGPYTVAIQWGDGSASSGSIIPAGGGHYAVSGTHTYDHWGDYVVEMDVRSTSTGLSVYATAVVSPEATALSIPIRKMDLSAPIYQRVVGTFTTDDTALTAKDFYVRVDWGDDTWSFGQLVGSNGQFYVVAPAPDDVLYPHVLNGYGNLIMQVTVYEWSNKRSDGSQLPLLVQQAHQSVSVFEAGVGSVSDPEAVGWIYTKPYTVGDVDDRATLGVSMNWGDNTPIMGAHEFSTIDHPNFPSHLFTKSGLFGVVGYVEQTPTLFTAVAGSVEAAPDLPGIIATTPVVAGNMGVPLQTVAADNTLHNGVQLVTFLDQDVAAKLDHFTPFISWGDGSPDAPGVVSYAHGVMLVTGYHTYRTVGTFTILIKIYSSDPTIPDTVGAATAVITVGPGVLYQRFLGTLLDVGASPAADGGQVTVAPNTGTLQVYQPLDPRISHDSSMDGFIDVRGNPLQGMISGDGRLLNLPVGATSGSNTFDALVYSSDRVDPHPIAEAYAAFDPANGVPTEIDVTLTWNNGTPQTMVPYTVGGGHTPDDTYLVGDQLVASVAPASGAYPWSMTAKALYSGGGNQTLTFNGTALVDNENASPFGPGWTLDGLNHLVVQTNGVLMLFGSGAAPQWYPKDGSGNFPVDLFFGTLVAVGGGYTYTSKYGIVWRFDGSGNMTSITDPHSLVATFTYSSGNPTRLAWPDGGTTTFAYSGSFVTLIQEPGSRNLGLTQGSNLTGITDVDGTSRAFGYDSHHHLTSLNWSPLLATYTYDSTSGVLTGVNRGLGTSYTLRPSNVVLLQTRGGVVGPDAAVAQWTDPRTNLSTYTLDLNGWVGQLDTPDSAHQYWYRDWTEQVAAYADQNIHWTQYQYDNSSTGKGDDVALTYADGKTEQYAYDSTYHRMTRLADANGNVTTYSYNSHADLTQIQEAAGALTSYGWSSSGLETSSTDGRGFTTNYLYAPSRLKTQTVDALTLSVAPLTFRSTYAYDNNGYLAGVQDQRGNWTTYTNDARGRVTAEHHADNGYVTMTYDAIGDLTSYQDGNKLLHPIVNYYEQRGWLTTTLDNWGGYVNKRYDAAGNLTSLTDQMSVTTTYLYDIVNRQTTLQMPAGGRTTMGYDYAGNLTTSKDPGTNITTYTYDGRNRQIQVEDANQGYTTTTYDGVGNVLTVENGDREFTSFGYDQNNRQTSVTDALLHTSTTVYDFAGNVSVTIDDRSKRTTYTYDADERQIQVQDARNNFSTTVYDAAGNVSVSIDSRNKNTTYTYDSMNRQQSVQDADGGITTTVYDTAGNVIGIQDPLRGWTTTSYDTVNMLKIVTDPNLNVTTMMYYHDGQLGAVINPDGLADYSVAFNGDKQVQTTWTKYGVSSGFAYSPAGDLTTVTDEHGKITTYAYDALHRRTLATHTLGGPEKWSYDDVGNILSYTDGLNRTTTYQYDADNHQTLVIHPLLDTEQTQYDEDGNLTSVTDGDGHPTTYQYDEDGNQTAIIDALNHITTQLYDQNDRLTSVMDSATRITTYQYDDAGRQVVTINALTARTTTSYDPTGQVTKVQDPAGSVLTAYDSAGRVTLVTDRRGISRSTSYDKAGQVTATTTGRSGTISTVYGVNPYQYQGTTVTDPMGYIYGGSYYADGDALSYVDPLYGTHDNNVGYSEYDADNRMTFSRDMHYRGTWLQYDAANEVTFRQVDDRWVTYTYDNDGRLLTEKGPLVEGASFSYDFAGNVTAQSDALGETTSLYYDELNRVTLKIDPLTHRTTTTYDSFGNVLSVRDSDNNLTTYAYDVLNELTSSTDPAGHHTSWAYNLAGQMTSTTDANNRTINKTYDGNGNVTGETWLASNGTTVQDTLTYQYDYDNMVTFARNNAGTYTMAYDLDDRLTSIQGPFGVTMTYGYDGMGDITSQQDNLGGILTSTYDEDQELFNEQFTQSGTVTAQIGVQLDYNEDGTYSQIRFYATAAETAIQNTTRFTYLYPGAVGYIYRDHSQGEYDYTYTSDSGKDDGEGQVQTSIIHGVRSTFSYDGMGQLSTSQNSVYGNHTYVYDAAGNSAAAGTTIGTDNQISTDGVWNYYYDNVGNRIAKINIASGDGWSYTYDDANRLIDVQHLSSHTGTAPSGTLLLEESFTYDVFGNRLSQTLSQSSSTTVTRFAYDQYGNAWADLNSSNQLITRRVYLQGVDQLFARIDGSTGHGYYYYTGKDGSVYDIVDESTGNIIDAIDYDPYGNLVNETATSYGDRYKYTGREWDAAIGLQYNRARFYDPQTRTFISPDPAQADPLGNTYRYVENDPMDQTDPSGLWNFFNPLTWGTATPAGYSSFNPFGKSALWGATGEGLSEGGTNIANGTKTAATQAVYAAGDVGKMAASAGSMATNAAGLTSVYVPEYSSALAKGAVEAGARGELAKYTLNATIDAASLNTVPLIKATIAGDAKAVGNVAGGAILAAAGAKISTGSIPVPGLGLVQVKAPPVLAPTSPAVQVGVTAGAGALAAPAGVAATQTQPQPMRQRQANGQKLKTEEEERRPIDIALGQFERLPPFVLYVQGRIGNTADVEMYPFDRLSGPNDNIVQGTIRAMQTCHWIHFNMEGMEREGEKGFDQYVSQVQRKDTNPKDGPTANARKQTNVTNWELYLDLSTPTFKSKTTFYDGTKGPIDAPNWLP
jgi:RHS repeat-associated protein